MMAPRTVAIVAPHPDDETLGAGGTLFRHRDEGDRIFWIVMTRMGEDFSLKRRKSRAEELEKVTSLYGFEGRIDMPFETTTLQAYPIGKVIEALDAAFRSIQPDTVYLPFRGDVHSDHRVTFDAAFACTKVFRHPYVRHVLMYEVLSETDFSPAEAFQPNIFVDVTNFFGKKCQALSIYESELGDHPFPRSLEGTRALATVRGAAAGTSLAEGFMLVKEIV